MPLTAAEIYELIRCLTHRMESLKGRERQASQSHDELQRLASLVNKLKKLAPDTDPAIALSWSQLDAGEQFIGASRVVGEIRKYIRQVAETTCNVLITGETGTGKELVADLIFRNSKRSNRPYVCVNSAAMPEGLLESELFGFKKGAFTGAYSSSEGKLASANGGTVFFDEIGDMSLSAQAKILRVIDSKEVYPLGSKLGIATDFRVLAATNRNLDVMVEEGKFRRDLYYRLKVGHIELPPLRERKQDIPLLLNHFLTEFNWKCGACVEGLTPKAIETVLSYDWPGNIRELRNAVEAAFITRREGLLSPVDLPSAVLSAQTRQGPASESDRLLAALTDARFNVSKAAEQLHWARMTVYRKMAKYSISLPPLRQSAKSCPPASVTLPEDKCHTG